MGYTDERILDGLIAKKVTLLEAERLGLGASEAEVKDRITKTFSDPNGKFLLTDASGKLDMSKYQERVGDVGVFERGVAEDIARENVRAGPSCRWSSRSSCPRPRAARRWSARSRC